VAGVLNFRALRQQPFTAALATTSERSATTFGAHPRTETVLAFPGAFRAL
jgi:hypothetical protein